MDNTMNEQATNTAIEVSQDNEKKYTCPRCKYATELRANMVLHVNKKKLCPPKHSDVSLETMQEMFKKPEPKLERKQCTICNKYVCKQVFRRHRINCEKKHSTTVESNDTPESTKQSTNNEVTDTEEVAAGEEDTNTSSSEVQCKKKKKKANIQPLLRHTCWIKYMGETFWGKCVCCGNNISSVMFHCAHVIAESKGGETTIENMRPVCMGCNYSMGTENMRDFARRTLGVTLE